MASAAEKLQDLLEGPALEPPPGTVSNFVDPFTLRRETLIVGCVFFIISTISVLIRFYTQVRINKKLRLEDYLCFLAWATYVAANFPFIYGTDPGGVRHQWNVRFKDLQDFLFNLHVGSVIYCCVILPIKISVLVQYIRIFSPSERQWFYWSCHALIWLNFLLYTILFFIEIFPCNPRAKAWDPLITTGKCLDLMTINVVSSALNVVSDFIILLLPQRIIWNLQLSVKKRLGISLVFATALLACISAALRLYYANILAHSKDITWYTSLMGLCVLPELSLGIVIACLPTFPKFFKSLQKPAIFTKISTFLYRSLRFFRFPNFNVSSWHPVEVSTPAKKDPSLRITSRLDTYDRLSEGQEMQSTPPKPDANSLTGEEEVLEGMGPMMGGRILRTTHVTSVSMPQRQGTSSLGDTPWVRNHCYHVSVERGSS